MLENIIYYMHVNLDIPQRLSYFISAVFNTSLCILQGKSHMKIGTISSLSHLFPNIGVKVLSCVDIYISMH